MVYTAVISVFSASGGYVVPSTGTYSYQLNALVTVTAHPYSGFEFDHWDIDGSGLVSSYPLPTYEFAVPGPVTLVANFIVAGSRVNVGLRPGVLKSAHVPMTNPTSRAFDYDAELSLGPGAAISSLKSFHLNAGELRNIDFLVTMPGEAGLYPVYLSIMSGGKSIALYRALEDVRVIAASTLLYELTGALEEAIALVEAGYTESWVMVPGYGLQSAESAIGQIKQLMIVEAIGLGLIVSSSDAYFVRSYMYYKDGMLIVPEFVTCQYCGQKFKSPALLNAHLNDAHWEIISSKGSIIGHDFDLYCYDPPICDIWEPKGLEITWRNDSPFAIQGHLEVRMVTPGNVTIYPAATSGQDAIIPPGASQFVYFPIDGYGQFWVTLTRIDGLLLGLILDGKEF